MTAKRSELKRQLLEQARKRPTARASQPTAPATSAGATRSVPERFTRFDAHPGYQQLSMMRQGAQQLGLQVPFFKVHDGLAGATSVMQGRTCINFAV